jgi:predicted DNA-binding transcriptional regulator AlpA
MTTIPNPPAPLTLTRPEICQLLRLSGAAFDQLRTSGGFDVEPIDWNGRPRWSRAAIAHWLGGPATLPDDDFALLTMAEVAQLLGIARATAYRNIPSSSLQQHAIRLAGDIRYPRIAIRRCLGV